MHGKIYDNIMQTMGNTPLVRFPRITDGVPADLCYKLEFFNPIASVKDRIGIAMIEALEAEGKLKPGGTIVEPTSGNTGIGIAFAAAALVVWMALPLDPARTEGTAHPALFTALVGCALLVGTAEVFRDNASQTMLPAMVPHDHLERANGRLWSVELVGNSLLGPALGAVLIASVVWLPFALNAVAFCCAAGLILRVRGQFTPKQTQSRDWRAELRQGLAFLRDAPLLRLLAVLTGVWNLLHQMVVIALVLHVQENLGLGATSYGLILAAGAFGGIAGGFVADRVVARLGPGRTAQWMTLASALAFAAVPLAPNGFVLALVLAAFEFTGLIWTTVSVSYRQRSIPDALLGRVNSIYRLLAWGMMPIACWYRGRLSACQSPPSPETSP